VALSLELGADLPVEGLLVRFHGQEHVGPQGRLKVCPWRAGRAAKGYADRLLGGPAT
jgi:hypothetical protein